MINDLKERIKNLNNYDGRGTSSKCYLVDEYALLYGSIELETAEYRKQLIDSYISQGINIARILEYQVDSNAERRQYNDNSTYQDGWTLQQRAKGKELYDRWEINVDINNIDSITSQYYQYLTKVREYLIRVKQFAATPQEHFNKFIKDYAFLIKSPLLVDPSKPTNFFYDAQVGFTFIDLNLKAKNINKEFENDKWMTYYVTMLLTPVIPTMQIYQEGYNRHGMCEYGAVILPTDIMLDINNSLSIIISKLKQGFLTNKISDNIINEEIGERLERFTPANQEGNIYIDDNKALDIVVSILNKIIIENSQKEVISDKQHADNYGRIRIRL